MPLEPNQMLSHYRLVVKIGEGGMGVVWKADDTKLGRQVAIKVLPEEFSQDSQRLARFEREAKLLATLNHPNVATIYGFEAAEGLRFLVLELVDGQTLAEQLKTATIPVSEALDYCCQVAEGLEAAHASGVIHRDLKPGNVIVTGEGRAKVLDFGLAKGLASEDGGTAPSDLSLSPTVTFGGTQAGVVLGTAPYMSPEQARGKALDKRTDIWSFGCLLYECLAGRPAFGGETVTDTLSAILQNEPDWEALPERTPRRVRDLLERCLEKNPRNRLHDIGDARIDLERCIATKAWTTSGIARAAAEATGNKTSTGVLVTLIVLGIAVAVLGTALLIGSAARPTGGPPHRKFTLQTSGRTLIMPSISPNGKTIAYSADGKLWLRDLDRLTPREVPAGEGTSPLTWSPDGDWLVVADDRELSKIHVVAGNRTALAQMEVIAPVVAGAGWEPDGTITFCTGTTGLLTVPAQGGSVGTRLEPGEGEQDFHHVSALPDGRGVVYVVHRDEGMDTLAVLAGGSHKAVLVLPGATLSDPVYSPTGHLLYVVGERRMEFGDALWAVPFALEKLETTGSPFFVSERAAQPSVSEDGTLVRFAPRDQARTRLVRVDRTGKVMQQLGDPGIAQSAPAFAPDGRRLAFGAVVDGNTDLWILDITSGTQQRLTFQPAAEGMPAWSPSGDQIAFASSGTEMSIKIIPSDGAGEAKIVAEVAWLPNFSPDGNTLAFVQADAALNPGLWYRELQGESEPVLFLEAGLWDESPRISPYGGFIAYSSDELGSMEVYVRPFPKGDGRWQVSLGGGRMPVWSPSGDRLYYLQGNDLMEAAVQVRPTVSIGTPRKLFTWSFPPVPSFDFTPLFDVDPDGESFVMVEDTQPGAAWAGIVVVENWIAEFGG